MGKMDYAINAGGGGRILGPGPGDLSCLETYPECRAGNRATLEERDRLDIDPVFDGIATERSEVKLRQVKDGTSHTILVAEKSLNPLQYQTGDNCADNNSIFQGNDWDNVRWVPTVTRGRLLKVTERMPITDTPGYENCSERFGSAHTSVFQSVFCDGSVRAIGYDIDMWVWAAAGTRGKSETVGHVE